jgi:hypothetical protein
MTVRSTESVLRRKFIVGDRRAAASFTFSRSRLSSERDP